MNKSKHKQEISDIKIAEQPQNVILIPKMVVPYNFLKLAMFLCMVLFCNRTHYLYLNIGKRGPNRIVKSLCSSTTH